MAQRKYDQALKDQAIWNVRPFSYKESDFYLKALPSHVDAVQTAQVTSNLSYCVVGQD